MRLLIDENMGKRRLVVRLLTSGHDVVVASDIGLDSVNDALVLAWAATHARPILTRDHEDFAALHDLVCAVGGHHPGILVVRFDNDPRNNLSDPAIAMAIANLESSGVMLTDQVHVLNHWR